MQTKLFCRALWVFGLFGSVLGGLPMPSLAQEDASKPFDSKPFVLDGVVAQVDGDRDRVTFYGDDGRIYTLDTATADIIRLDGSSGGMTLDLAPGMRVHVSGKRISTGIAKAETVRVLAAQVDRSRPIRPQKPAVVDGADIQLRGTVDSIDTRRGAFVVRVSTHTRTVFLGGQYRPDRNGIAQSQSFSGQNRRPCDGGRSLAAEAARFWPGR